MAVPYREIRECRICGNPDLVPILHLGNQALTGVFPASREEVVTSGPLELVKCAEDGRSDSCGLVQLRQTYDPTEMFGDGYGYRSGLNRTMVQHLRAKVAAIGRIVGIEPGDLIVDIGSNDGTLLASYPENGADLVGIDPTAIRFREHYPEHVRVLPEFFSPGLVRREFGARKAKVVTSLAMFYDLDDPMAFMTEIGEVLDDDGVWVFEQSYMPAMLDANAYDTICHEHLEYYRLKQIRWMAQRAGIEIIDVEFNQVNGGSFSVVAAKSGSRLQSGTPIVESILRDEEARGLGSPAPYERFRDRVLRHRDDLREFIDASKARGERTIGYGASTKGNVILQFCHVTPEDIPYMAEVNVDKFGRFTPGTRIPIIEEGEARAKKPDYLMVMPWHFRDFIVGKEAPYLESGGKLLFPLPRIDVVSS